MLPHNTAKRRVLVVCIMAALSSVFACSSEKNVTAPVPSAPSPSASTPPAGSGPPIEIREDAFVYGFLAPVTIRSARLEGRTLRLEVSYAGGCSTHTFAVIGGTRFLSSYPAQYPVVLRHDDAGDPCDSTVLDELSFDVTPAVELFHACNGADGPFYLDIITPPDRTIRAQVLIGTNPLVSLRAPTTK
jgi:hypothetical protein